MRSLVRVPLLALGIASFALAQPPMPGPEIDGRFAGAALAFLVGCLALRKRR